MNIFALDDDPDVAATLHCDKHVIKMILESAQMLSTAVYERDAALHDVLEAYKPTHTNHPCSVWVRASKQNFLWLCDLGRALSREHEARYTPKRPHKSAAVIARLRDVGGDCMPPGPRTPFAQAMPLEYQGADSVIAYRRYYAGAKASIATYRAPRTPPEFMRS